MVTENTTSLSSKKKVKKVEEKNRISRSNETGYAAYT